MASNTSLETIRRQSLERTRERIAAVIAREPVDMIHLQSVISQELQFCSAARVYVDIPQVVLDGFNQISEMLQSCLSSERPAPLFEDVGVAEWNGGVGRPRLGINKETLESIIAMRLPMESMAKIHGVSRSTLCKRMREHDLSVRGTYSDIPDDELDIEVRSVKSRMPDAGYRTVKGALQAMGQS
ncbi:unnamed protein product [Knipowitschia caucasica]